MCSGALSAGAVRYGMGIGMPEGFTGEVAKVIIEQYKDVYPELKRNEAFVLEQLSLEESRFARTLKQGNREFEKLVEKVQDGQIDGVSAFHLYDTYGFPVEMTQELARERGLTVTWTASTSASASIRPPARRARSSASRRPGRPQRAERTPAYRHPPAARGAAQGAGPGGGPEGLQHHRRASAL